MPLYHLYIYMVAIITFSEIHEFHFIMFPYKVSIIYYNLSLKARNNLF